MSQRCRPAENMQPDWAMFDASMSEEAPSGGFWCLVSDRSIVCRLEFVTFWNTKVLGGSNWVNKPVDGFNWS